MNRNFQLEMIYIMADYLAFRCEYICKETHFLPLSKGEIQKEQQKAFETIAIVLNYKVESSVDSFILLLLRINTKKAYAVVLYRIYEKILTEKSLLKIEKENYMYVAILLCYKKWKNLVNYKDEKLKINNKAEKILPSKLPLSSASILAASAKSAV